MPKHQNIKKLQRTISLLPRVLILWIVSVVSLVFIEGLTKELVIKISEDEFQTKLLSNQQVSKIAIVNKDLVEVYIKPVYLGGKWHPLIEKTNEGPHYQFEIASLETFRDKFQQMFFEQKIVINYVGRDLWREVLLSWLKLILLVSAIWFFILMIGLSAQKRKLKTTS